MVLRTDTIVRVDVPITWLGLLVVNRSLAHLNVSQEEYQAWAVLLDDILDEATSSSGLKKRPRASSSMPYLQSDLADKVDE